MDFRPVAKLEAKIEPKKNSSAKPRPRKLRLRLILPATIIALAAGVYLFKPNASPIPPAVKSQFSFKAIYPTAKAGKLDASGYTYSQADKTLSFNIVPSGNKIVFTEQSAPNSVSSGSQVYYPALGLHPYAQFQSKLGPVALAKFYVSGNLTPKGQSALLVAQGTLVIAHPDKNLTNARWKDLFDNLKISQ